MSSWIAAFIVRVGRVLKPRNGNVSMLFGLAAIPVVIAAGMAVDVTRAYTAKERLGAALDAAALAVGSETGTQAQLTTDLNNYFAANYPASLGSATIATVPANQSLTAATVNFTATASVPTTFMRLAGFDTMTVTVTNQIHRTQGLEVAMVLDNTGSMLCGQNDGAPNYSDSLCSQGVVSSDTSIQNCSPSDEARICSLGSAANLFVSTLFSKITTPNQLYISVIPYVTTVNVGQALCTGATADTCTGFQKNANNQFIDQYGNISYIPSLTASANVTKGSNIVSSISSIKTSTVASSIKVGMVITGTSASLFPANTTVTSVDSATQIHVSQNAIISKSATGLTFGTPLTYDSSQSLTSPKWLGCTIEATSSDEMISGSLAQASTTTDPDVTEPSSGWPGWYAYYWMPNTPSGANKWKIASSSNIVATPPTLGAVVANYDQDLGPNLGCPVPALALSSDQTTITNTINSMWPRDASGTQVNVGMIWGWRALSPYGPFPKNNGHPLDYTTATNTGWMKVVVLETDGTEEWPLSTDYTGMGVITDGKLDTTSTGTAQTNAGARLAAICQAMKQDGIIIYTIGLGSDGASNTDLKNCPANGGYFLSATDKASLQAAFTQIANSLLALRLTQ